MFARAKHLFRDGMKRLGRRFISDRAGNLAMSFAIVSVPLLGAMGVGLDYVRALNLHREIQGNLDAALVATVKNIDTKDDEALKLQLANWLIAEAQDDGSYALDPSSINIDRTNYDITARVTATVDTTFMRVLGKTEIPISVEATVVGGKTVTASAFSMYLVLDRSGSMSEETSTTYTTKCGWVTCTKKYTKMESLKLAVDSLATQFKTADPDMKYVRTAAVSYNDKMQTPSGLNWGSDDALAYVNKLSPGGLTNSSAAMNAAYDVLKVKTGASSEDVIHKAKNGAEPKKYIVLMTDGENTKTQNGRTVDNPEADASTRDTCDDAKKADIIIYAIGLYTGSEVSKRGEALLKYCATTTSDHYFIAKDTATLIKAFEKIGAASSDALVRLTN